MARDVTIRYIGDASSAQRASLAVVRANQAMERKVGGITGKLKSSFKSIGSSFAATGQKIIKVGALAAVGGIAALGVGLVSAFKAAQESLKVGRQTEQVIKTMGASSWTSSKQISAFSERLAQLTGVDDEIIQQGANLVLTFKNIQNQAGKGNDVFDRTVTLANDMSVALGQDMKSSSIQLGKALNDPIKGVTALRRVGVSFTQSQIDQIKVLTESGNLLGAQRLILKEVESQFGGTAKAVATPWDRLKVTLGNIQEEIGMRLMPVIDRVVFFFNNLWPRALKVARQVFDAFMAGFRNPDLESGRGIFRIAQELGQAAAAAWPHVKRIGEVIADVGKAVINFFKANPAVAFTVLATVIGTALLAAVVAVAAAIAAAISPFIVVTAAIAALTAGVVYAYTRWGWFRDAVDTTISWFSQTAIPAVQKFASAFIGTFRGIAEAISHAMSVIRGVITVALKVIQVGWNLFGQTIMGYVRAVWTTISAIIGGFLKSISGLIKTVLAVINGDWSRAWAGIKQIFAGQWQAIKGVLTGALTFVKAAMSNAGTLIRRAWGATWDWIKGKATGVWRAIAGGVRSGVNAVIGVINGLIGGLNRVLSILPGLGGKTIRPIGLIGAPRSRGDTPGHGGRGRAAGGTIPPFVTDGPRAIVGEGNRAFPEFVIPTDPKYRSRALALLGQAGSKLMASGGEVPRYAVGGILPDDIPGAGIVKGAVGAVGDIASGVAEFARKGAAIAIFGPFNKIAEKAINAIPWRIARQFGQGVRQWLYDWVKGQDDKLPSAAGGGATGPGSGISGLREPLASIVAKVLAAGRGAVSVISGWRSRASQERLYARYLAGTGNLAARPGTSKHERGLAVDYGGNQALYQRLHRSFGGHFPVRGEPWHGEVPGYQHGGTVAQDGFAYLHRGENVVPATRGRTTQVVNNINVYVQGGDPNALVETLKKYMRQNGPVPIKVRG